ncbi:hypothetical protein [Paraburkholderia kirstenboschensis]|uniref:Transposase n=1 Tax=Paraburkholderia kirstenboschensis TaxID=1245436 RepID=A0ABZ0ED81_9BURK|nr:hypothetical protein [Paraburkholderia kirstenboschensis]WOD15183.1 hypothetical protein RW095_17890 [Paraburkholderia kirstenboschensis]
MRRRYRSACAILLQQLQRVMERGSERGLRSQFCGEYFAHGEQRIHQRLRIAIGRCRERLQVIGERALRQAIFVGQMVPGTPLWSRWAA